MASNSTSERRIPASSRQYLIDKAGNPAQCLILLNLSSSAAAKTTPSTRIQADASP